MDGNSEHVPRSPHDSTRSATPAALWDLRPFWNPSVASAARHLGEMGGLFLPGVSGESEVILRFIPGAVPVVPGAVPATPGAVPTIPGAVPVIPGAVPVIPGAVPVTPGAVRSFPE